jgi:hypothetical protein
MSKRTRISVGPFAEAERRVGEFGTNVAASYILLESIERYEKVKQEYEEALKTKMDDKKIQQMKTSLEACRITVTLATQLYTQKEQEGGPID